jgi:hypothetical protein
MVVTVFPLISLYSSCLFKNRETRGTKEAGRIVTTVITVISGEIAGHLDDDPRRWLSTTAIPIIT